MTERRARSRLALHYPLEIVTSEGVFTSVTENLSAIGLYCLLPQSLILGELVECKIRLPGSAGEERFLLHCCGRVVRIKTTTDDAVVGTALEIIEFTVLNDIWKPLQIA